MELDVVFEEEWRKKECQICHHGPRVKLEHAYNYRNRKVETMYLCKDLMGDLKVCFCPFCRIPQ